jgi:hypothetical protein
MVRHVFSTAGLVMASLLAGCGGGGGHSVEPPPPVVPALSAIAPTSANAGTATITLSVYGTNFSQNGGVVEWNGAPLTSTWVSATLMTATIPAANLASAGSAQVTVVNPDPAGGTSAARTFTVLAAPSGRTWVRAVPGIATPHDVAWDAVHGNLYVSVAASDPVIPNTVVPVNPFTGIAGTPVAAGNDPNLLAVSSDSSYLWVGLDGGNAVQRFLLPSLATDISFPVPLDWRNAAQQVVALQAAPVNPHTVALIAGHWNYSPQGDGVYVFDDATQRPVFVPGSGAGGGPGMDWIQWGANDSAIYGNAFSGAIDTLAVTPSGVSVTNLGQGDLDITVTHYVSSDGLLYSMEGAYNPANSSQVGSFDLPALAGTVCTADSSLSRQYCVVSFSLSGSDIQKFEMWVYDLSTHVLLDRVSLGVSAGGPRSPVTGLPVWLVRWGNAGLALVTVNDTARGSGGFFLIDGTAVNPNVAPDTASGVPVVSYAWMASLTPQQVSATSTDLTVTINGTNFAPDSTACYFCGYGQAQYLPTTYVSPQQLKVTVPASMLTSSASLTPGPLILNVFDPGSNLYSTNALGLTVGSLSSDAAQVTALNLAGLAMAWDANSQLLYVGVADWDSAYPNSILSIDGQSGAVVKMQAVAPNPDLMSVSANGQYLYAAFAGSTNMTQLQLPGLGSPLTWALADPTGAVFYAGDVKSAPVSPHTTAVTLLFVGISEIGVVVYDDIVLRPGYAPGRWTGGPPYDTVAWGTTDQILTAAASTGPTNGPLYELQVSPSGVALQAAGTAPFNLGTMHSDFGTGLIYSDDGNVADPNTLAIVGSYGASGLVVPDSSLNRVFVLGQTGNQVNTNNYTIQSFDEKAYTQVSSLRLNNLLGNPIALARWGTSGLAVLTMNGGIGPAGMLYLIQDPTFVSSAAHSSFARPQELAQRRWKPISKADIVRMIHKRRPADSSGQAETPRFAIQKAAKTLR